MTGFQTTTSLACLLACVLAALAEEASNYKWENNYGWWRDRAPAAVDEWAERFPVPLAAHPPLAAYNAMDDDAKHEAFLSCINDEAFEFSKRTMSYRAPLLADVTATVRAELDKRGMGVTLTVFWGRMRYVEILAYYLKRNLRVNGGIVDKVIPITFARVPGAKLFVCSTHVSACQNRGYGKHLRVTRSFHVWSFLIIARLWGWMCALHVIAVS